MTRAVVVDASVAIGWVHPAQATAHTGAMLEAIAEGATLEVPALWPLEVANALTAPQRRRKLTEDERQAGLGWLRSGVGLFAYKGLTNRENTLLNLAAICAFVVALYPERLSLEEAAKDPRVAQLFASCPAVETWATIHSYPIHYISAVLLFVAGWNRSLVVCRT